MTTPTPEPTAAGTGPEEYSDHVLASRVWGGTEYYYPHLTSLKERCRTLLAQRDAALARAEGAERERDAARATLCGPALALAKLMVNMRQNNPPPAAQWMTAMCCAQHVIDDATDALKEQP
jgi:hypothetical protein